MYNHKLKQSLKKISNKKYCILFSRATSAIYSIFNVIGEKNKKIVFPSNLCLNPVYAAIFAKSNFTFSDINYYTGNFSISSLTNTLSENKNISMIFCSHMYGIPNEVEKIKKKIGNKNIFLIEDCAQSMGTEINNNYLGSFGEIAIYSFGYSKNIDCDYGGALLTNDYKIFKEIEKFQNKDIDFVTINELRSYKKEYLKQYYNYINSNKKMGFNQYININHFKKLFVNKIKNNWIKKASLDIKKINYLRKIRNEKRKIYDDQFNNKIAFSKFDDNFFPWRYNIYIPDQKRDKLLTKLWSNNIHANKLYHSLPKFLFNNTKYKNSILLEKNIINLWLDESVNKKYIKDTSNFIVNNLNSNN